MAKKKTYRYGDLRMYLTGLKLDTKVGDPLGSKIGIAVKTTDKKFGAYFTYDDLAEIVLKHANSKEGGK